MLATGNVFAAFADEAWEQPGKQKKKGVTQPPKKPTKVQPPPQPQPSPQPKEKSVGLVALRNQLKQLESLQLQRDMGKSLNKDQTRKLAGKVVLEKQIADLELKDMSPAQQAQFREEQQRQANKQLQEFTVAAKKRGKGNKTGNEAGWQEVGAKQPLPSVKPEAHKHLEQKLQAMGFERLETEAVVAIHASSATLGQLVDILVERGKSAGHPEPASPPPPVGPPPPPPVFPTPKPSVAKAVEFSRLPTETDWAGLSLTAREQLLVSMREQLGPLEAAERQAALGLTLSPLEQEQAERAVTLREACQLLRASMDQLVNTGNFTMAERERLLQRVQLLLRQVTELESLAQAGQSLSPEQQRMVSGKPALLARQRALSLNSQESQRPPSNSVSIGTADHPVRTAVARPTPQLRPLAEPGKSQNGSELSRMEKKLRDVEVMEEKWKKGRMMLTPAQLADVTSKQQIINRIADLRSRPNA